jgi:hypothetical protein
VTIEAAFWDDPDVQRLAAEQHVEVHERRVPPDRRIRRIRRIRRLRRPPDAEDSLYFEREIG